MFFLHLKPQKWKLEKDWFFFFRQNTTDTHIHEAQIPRAFPWEHLYFLLPFKIFWDMLLCLSRSALIAASETNIHAIIFNPYTCDYRVINGAPAFLPLPAVFSTLSKPTETTLTQLICMTSLNVRSFYCWEDCHAIQLACGWWGSERMPEENE